MHKTVNILWMNCHSQSTVTLFIDRQVYCHTNFKSCNNKYTNSLHTKHLHWIWHQHIEAETKWPWFSRQYLQMHFLEWKYMNFDWNFAEACVKGSNQQYSSIGSDNGLVPTRRQAIIWINARRQAVFQITASPCARSRQLWRRTSNFLKKILQLYVYDLWFKAEGLTTFLTEFWTLRQAIIWTNDV